MKGCDLGAFMTRTLSRAQISMCATHESTAAMGGEATNNLWKRHRFCAFAVVV